MGKDLNPFNEADFSFGNLLEEMFAPLDCDHRGYPENGSSQGITPRERNENNGIDSSSNVKDTSNKIMQELINILNTVLSYQKEKLYSKSENVIGNASQVIVGERGITEWILMSKVNRIDSNLMKEFLKNQRDLAPYDYYKLVSVFEDCLEELRKKLRRNPQDISNVDFVMNLKLIQRFVTNKFLETKFNQFLKMIYSEKRVVVKYQSKRNEKINHPFIIRYLDDLKEKNLSKGRFKKMQTDSKRLAEWLCNYREFENYDIHTLPLWLVRRDHLIEYKNYLINKEKHGEFTLYGCKQHFKNVKTLFKRLYQLDLISSNITENIPNIEADDYIYRDLPTEDEIIKLFQIIRTYSNKPLDDCLAFALMAYLGFRCVELFGLKWENINEGTQSLTLKSKGRNKYHNLPIPEIVLSLIQQYPERDRHGFVFKSENMNQNSLHVNLFKKFVLFKEMAGWNYQDGVHLLRHWFITKLSSQNIELGDLRTIARHDDLTTTSKYIHSCDEDLKDDINKMFEGDVENGLKEGNLK